MKQQYRCSKGGARIRRVKNHVNVLYGSSFFLEEGQVKSSCLELSVVAVGEARRGGDVELRRAEGLDKTDNQDLTGGRGPLTRCPRERTRVTGVKIEI
ncbi:hypothetical protein J6590_097950 [Homalodisca vitripennis]|nr:hypothetical protein J6590_009801 [Homalodisca vitripennis]KAG8334071.1 hypothetical protein J6590_097950 [Homalodisca vitripennis]